MSCQIGMSVFRCILGQDSQVSHVLVGFLQYLAGCNKVQLTDFIIL